MRFVKTPLKALFSLRFDRCVVFFNLMEREIENPCVVGSIPTLGTIFPPYAHIKKAPPTF